MSHGLVPSKSTVYISNLPYELKNNDLHKIFGKYGRLVRVTVLKDKTTKKSRGVAFLLYLHREDAKKCVENTHQKELFGRTLKASIANDNGRSTEFIRKKVYPDKSFCYECGAEGHLSYKCDKNLLGEREPPPKKAKKKTKKSDSPPMSHLDEYQYFEEDCETLGAAIALEHEKYEIENRRQEVATEKFDGTQTNFRKPKRIIKTSYFSDEEESD